MQLPVLITRQFLLKYAILWWYSHKNHWWKVMISQHVCSHNPLCSNAAFYWGNNRALLESLSSALEKERGKGVTERENCVVSISRGGVFLTGPCSRPSCGPSTGPSLSLNTENMASGQKGSLQEPCPLKRLLFIQISPITKTTWLWTDQMALKYVYLHTSQKPHTCVLEVTCTHMPQLTSSLSSTFTTTCYH